MQLKHHHEISNVKTTVYIDKIIYSPSGRNPRDILRQMEYQSGNTNIVGSIQRWATGWKIGVLGFDSRWGLGIFLFTTASRTVLVRRYERY
jgi:hypothetical protein